MRPFDGLYNHSPIHMEDWQILAIVAAVLFCLGVAAIVRCRIVYLQEQLQQQQQQPLLSRQSLTKVVDLL